jgi:serine/threonine protein kinase
MPSAQGIFGKYRLLVELGSGGMADVFLAVAEGPEGLGFSKLLVVKRLRSNLADDPEFIAMLVDEARIAGRLNHPNVVQTIEIGNVGKQYFIAMEYLDGQPLHRILARSQRIGQPLEAGLHYGIITEVLAGLHYAHELADYDGTPLQVVHRDVSPHNVFITYAGQVKVVDFGIAKAAGRVAETRTGVVKGKITYMAPEQALSRAHDRRADIFAVGIMLWQAATNERFWQGADEFQIMKSLAAGEYKASPRLVNPQVPEELDRICQRALALEPDHRYATALDFQTDLENFLESVRMRRAPRELGKRVSELFEDSRAEVKAVVEEQLAQLKTSSVANIRPVAIPTDPMSGTPISALRDHDAMADDPTSQISPGSGNREDTSAKALSAATYVSAGRPNRSFVGVAMVLAVAVLLGGFGIAFLSRDRAQAQGQGTRQPDPPPVPSGNVMVVLRGSPPEVKFTVDDGNSGGTPFIRRFTRDGKRHVVRADAPGYETEVRMIEFIGDQDIEIDFNLRKNAAEVVDAGPGPGPKQPPPRFQPSIRTPAPTPSTPTAQDIKPPKPPDKPIDDLGTAH